MSCTRPVGDSSALAVPHLTGQHASSADSIDVPEAVCRLRPRLPRGEVGLSIENLPRQIGSARSSKLVGLRAPARAAVRIASAYLRHAAGVIALLLGYLVLEWVSFIHEHKGMPVT